MTPSDFKIQLREFMARAMSDQPIPLGQMILELEIQKQRCLNIQMMLEAQAEANATAKKILPANGMTLPPRLKN